MRGDNVIAKPRRWSLRRAIALPLSAILAAVTLSVVPAQSADAAVVQWGTNSGSAPNFQTNVNGDFIMVGNGVLACAGAIANTVNGGVGTCADLHSTTISTNGNNVNDYFSMVNTNTAAGFTTNSSSATMTIPAGATVVKAFLSWSANTGVYNGATQPQCAATSTAAARLATLPTGTYTNRPVQLKIGAGAVGSIAPASVLVDPTTQPTSQYYSASADVTSAFTGATTGSPITVSAGDIWAPQGAGCFAGWSLAVVYDYGTFILGNTDSKPHNVIYYEGHVRQGAADAALTVAFTGFTAVETGTRVGLTLFEGDRNIVGDTASYSRGGATAYTQIPNANGASGNIGVGQAAGSVRYTQTGTGFTNQSVDVTSAPLPNIVSGDTTVNLQLGTSGDSYLLRNAILSVPIPGLQVTKTSAAGPDTQSRLSTEVAQFSITITNTGAGTLRNIVVSDDQTDCARTLTGIVLDPLQSFTYTCVANSASAASYVSTATATGYTVTGNYLAQDKDSTAVLLTAIALTKSSALSAGATGRAGDIVNYTFTATNTGGSTLTGVAITDPLIGLSALTYGAWPSGTSGTLTAGQAITATATYVLKQSDVDLGSVTNTAATTGSDDDAGPKPTATANRVQTITAAPLIAVTKSGTLASGATGKVGDRINYVFSFTNTGNVTLTNLVLNDPLTGLSPPVVTWPGTSGTLAPGQVANATAFYIIKQSDVDAGSVKNTATVTGRTPAGQTATGSSPQSSINTVATAATLSTSKSGAYSTGTGGVGSVVTYTFRATNTGNVTLTGVSIADPLVGLSALTYTWPGTAGTLAPGQFVTATATFTLKQSDVDAGSVKNTATTTATTPAGAPLSVPSAQSTVVTDASAPAVTLTKSGALAAGSTGRAGDVVNYSFRLTNSGNVTVTGVTITDPLPGLSALTFTWPGTPGTLAPGQFVAATATYVLKQSDVDAGSVANTASSSAKPPTGANLTQSRSATVPVVAAGVLTVLKSGSAPSGSGGVGSTITYSFSATNNGNVTLTQVAISDPLSGLSALSYSWPGVAGTLAPGQTVNATATYTIKQSDVDAGLVTNTATGTGRTPAGATVTGTSPTSRVNTQVASPSTTTVKSAAVSGTRSLGDVISYTFRTTNSGNVTLTNVTITDPLAGLSALSSSWPGAVGTLAPGQFVTATASYTIKQSDVNNGSVVNTAGSSANYGATAVSSTSNTLTTTLIAAAPDLAVTKSGALASGATGRAGETINWTITLRNPGNVTLTSVSASDSLPGISALTYGTWPSGTVGTLQPGQSVVATATYILKQTDVDAGAVSNTASGTGTPSTPGGTALTRTSPATVSLASAPGLTLTKSGAYSTGSGAVGSVITYTFTAANAGNVSLTAVSISDPLPNLSALTYTWPGTVGRLAPGQTVTATATYQVRQADIDSGSVRNTATAKGTPPTGAEISASSGQVTTPTQAAAPAITTAKRVTAGSGSAVGGVVSYEFTATNTGNVTLAGVSIADPKPGLSSLTYTWPGTAGILAPGQSVTATATYTVTQADQNAGSITNTSSASGTGGGRTVTASSGAVTTPTAASRPAIQVIKSANPTSAAQAGAAITYTFVLTNTGNVTLTTVGVADPLPGLSGITFSNWGSGTPGTLQPGQSATASATYLVKQSDVDAGSVANTATATGTPSTGAPVSGTGNATVTLPATPTISVAKTGSVTTGDGGVGSVITWGFTIRNTGNVTLTTVALTDSLAGLGAPALTWDGGTPGTLRPGQAATGTAAYTIRQADVDAGSVKNTASVTGLSPAGVTASANSGEITVPTKPGAPALTLTKSATPATGLRLGNVITYRFTLSNSGNQTITGASVTDPKPGLSAISFTWPGAVGVVAPGQSATGTATYLVTQADVDAGSTSNSATAAGTAPGTVAVTTATPTVTATTVAATPALSLSKNGSLANGSTGRAGDTANYTFTVRNTGNVTISAVSVTDPLPGLSAVIFPVGFPGSLAPGQSVIATASYTLTQADVDSGSVSNTASANGTPARGTLTAVTDVNTIPITSGPALTLGKTGAYTTGSGAVGSVITYTFTARNAGNVSLTGVTITDPKLGSASPIAVGSLAPNQSRVITAQYTLVQADINSGAVTNTASATGTTQTGATPTATSPTVRIPTVAAAPALETLKTGAYTTGSGAVGSVITYALSTRNAGNVTLTAVTITDSLLGISAVSYGSWPGGVDGVLQPGETVTGSATYTLTQADVNRGTVTNVATGTGTPPTGPAVTDDSATVTTNTAAAAPRLTVSKSGVLAADASTINWTISVLNDGNLTISGITLNDPLLGGSLTLSSTTLAPGQTATATATYPVIQVDVDAGAVSNTATAKGSPARGAEVTGTGSSTVLIPPTPAVSVTKSGVYTTGSGAIGSVITYAYTAVNDGNVTLSGVAISDPHPGLSALSYTWRGSTGTLAPGQSVTASATYTVVQADLDAGRVLDTATVTGLPPTGLAVTGTSNTVTVPTAAAAPSILTEKIALPGTRTVGDLVTYEFTLTNTGNVTLTSVSASDPKPGLSTLRYGTWPSTTGTLQPGEQVIATATYRLTQADVDFGTVRNTATGTGTPPTGPAVTSAATAETPTAPATPGLVVTKAGTLAPGATYTAGNSLVFSFTVRNTGNVTLTAVALNDQLVGLSTITYSFPAAAGTLAPGQTATATATYPLTQADLDRGSLDNSATASAVTPGAQPYTSPAGVVTVTLPPTARLDVVKQGTLTIPDRAEPGDTIDFLVTVRNSGNVTISSIALSDSIPGLVLAPSAVGSLAPGASATATARYTITAQDVLNKLVVNTATATGTSAAGATVTDASPEVRIATGAARAQLSLVKSAAYTTGTGGVGSVITYTFTVTNTGNQPITNVGIKDPPLSASAIAVVPSLAPGAIASVTRDYAVTQADVDAGRVDNSAAAVGTGPSPEFLSISSTASAVTTTTAAPRPAITVTDSGVLAATGPGNTPKAGDIVTWTYVLTNGGNVTLSSVTLADALPVQNLSYPAGPLSPGQSITGTSTYAITQADIDAGSVVSLVTGTGIPPGSVTPITATAPATVTLGEQGGLTLTKSASTTTDLASGDVVTFTFVISNTGNVTIDGITVQDVLPGLSTPVFPTLTNRTLAPGASATGTATYTFTQADVDNGGLINTATVSGTTPAGVTQSASGSVSLTSLAASPALTVQKRADKLQDLIVGEIISYTVDIKNTGT
ncbi:beta strand repeat-containing protein, partial [Salinibacterium sp.]|uniref:beta strand repeat-containing protein n=1 Tax=Salinibacterium sp. TaxID=1915057 RepID=UPI0037C772AA